MGAAVANVPQTVSVIAETSGWPKADVQMRARYLGPAGLLPKGGRGLNAPDLEPHHAANLLLATLCGGPQTEAVQAVQTCGAKSGTGAWLMPDGEAVPYAGPGRATLIPAGTTFLDSITQVLAWRRDQHPLGARIVGVGTLTVEGDTFGLIWVRRWTPERGDAGWFQLHFGNPPQIPLFHPMSDCGLITRTTIAPEPLLDALARSLR